MVAMDTANNTIWKTVKDFPNYMVSNTGLIKSLGASTEGMTPTQAKLARKERILKPQKHRQGYQMVSLSKFTKRGEPNQSKFVTVHSLVAQAFLGDRPKGLVINHRDNDPTNNNVWNLEYCTQQYNMQHSFDGGWRENNCHPVERYDSEGVMIQRYDSIKEATKEGYNRQCICRCCTGKQHTHLGFIWKYVTK